MSSPLVLGLDLTNKSNLDAVWPIISNREMLAVNEAWAGDAPAFAAFLADFGTGRARGGATPLRLECGGSGRYKHVYERA